MHQYSFYPLHLLLLAFNVVFAVSTTRLLLDPNERIKSKIEHLAVLLVFLIAGLNSLLFVLSINQGLWNLVYRETSLPRKQYRLERLILSILRFLRLVRQPSPKVPIEIWDAILREAIAVPFLLDVDCSSRTFMRFSTILSTRDHGKEDYSKSEATRRNLRLVCHLWKSLADQHRARWVRFPLEGTPPPKARRLSFDSYASESTLEKLLNPDFYSQLAIVNNWAGMDAETVGKVCGAHHSFVNLQALYIFYPETLPTGLLPNLGSQLPNLISLSLSVELQDKKCRDRKSVV